MLLLLLLFSILSFSIFLLLSMFPVSMLFSVSILLLVSSFGVWLGFIALLWSSRGRHVLYYYWGERLVKLGTWNVEQSGISLRLDMFFFAFCIDVLLCCLLPPAAVLLIGGQRMSLAVYPVLGGPLAQARK